MNGFERMPSGLFGGSARSQLLAALFVLGPMNRRRLARALGVDPTFTLQRLRSLVHAGLAERGESERDYRIAWSNPIAPYVASIIAAYTGLGIVSITTTVNAVLPPGHLGTFERPGRGRLLLALTGHEPATVSELADAAGLTLSMVQAAGRTLEDAGIVRADRTTRPMLYHLNAAQPAYNEIRALLRVMRTLGAYR